VVAWRQGTSLPSYQMKPSRSAMDMVFSPFAGNPEAEILADFAPRLAVKWRFHRSCKASAMVWKPNVTVASVLERDGRFLLVEEETEYGICYNQPAGHLECGESLIDAVIRETLEETAYHAESAIPDRDL
jgi:hypothetical protein